MGEVWDIGRDDDGFRSAGWDCDLRRICFFDKGVAEFNGQHGRGSCFAPTVGATGMDGGRRIDRGGGLQAESGVDADREFAARADGFSCEGFWGGVSERTECRSGAGAFELQELGRAKCEDMVSDGAGARISGRDHAGLFLLTKMAGETRPLPEYANNGEVKDS